MNYIPEFTLITSKFKPNNRGGFDIREKGFPPNGNVTAVWKDL